MDGAASLLISFANLPLLPFFLNFLPVISESSDRTIFHNGFTMFLQRIKEFVIWPSLNNASFFTPYFLIINTLHFAKPLQNHC